MRAQLIDGREPHHAFGHLCFDRAIGIQGIRHSIDDTRFENCHWRLILVSLGWRLAICAGRTRVRLGKCRWWAADTPRQRRLDCLERSDCGHASSNVAGGASVRFEGRRHGGRKRARSARMDRPFAPRRARVPSAMTRRTTDCVAASEPAQPRSVVGSHCARDREPRLPPARAGGQRWWRCRFCTAASQTRAGRDRKGNRHCPGYGRVGRHADRNGVSGRDVATPKPKLQRDVLQLSNDRPKTEHDGAGASRHRTGEDQGIAETEFLDRNSESDRQEAGQQNANPGDQQRNHHRITPRPRPKMLTAANAKIPSYCAYRQSAIAASFRA